MKVIAFHLPQFHRIPENDAWWGTGFTEWTNTSKAVSLYPGHLQPKIPYENYYYDLMDSSARQWQAIAAKTYGIYGFCYYHYWFKGKQLLEHPVKQMLWLGEPGIPFCLSWANESWTRPGDGGDNHILMEQSYGDKEDWTQHFYELLNMFRDPRYIRIDDKPLFLIYRPSDIPRCGVMLSHWNQLARENGLKGIYFVRTLGGFPLSSLEGFDAGVEFEPHYTLAHGGFNQIRRQIKAGDRDHFVIDYDHVWQMIINRSHRRDGGQIIPGAFVGWDNTPRMGYLGQSTIGASPQKFEWYLSRQIERAKSLYNSEFLFVNAWNEWAEGSYLEPDQHYGFQYLEAVRSALKAN
ncbi:glycosyl transferase family WbsX [Fontibacillus phaseoli]|uniref:Glycosyl transferase family WbsX n=1 Tax=Fontibacillus phaseoli TaxID=1416533 RepID=A0A369BSB5_9BACL|nr:glycoside hydrolase family 99-like domain-containing protein [Fontibacillus phaseoli]RCX23486.1 glycosyl transferase family WbsX [Fontibacillus phaseoli]